MELQKLGWSSSRNVQFEPFRAPQFIPARVAEEHRERYVVFCEPGELSAEVSGKLRFDADTRLGFPAVGDWVALQPAGDSLGIIHALLPRSTLFVRKVAGETTEAQAVAANVDYALVVTDADRDFNLRRIERYLTLVYESGAAPVIVLNKADLCDHVAKLVAEIERVAVGVPICPVSAAMGSGLETLQPFIGPGQTSALIGSSGVGKSTLINRLLGVDQLKTSEVRESDGRGRHTTTYRQLLLLPTGGLVIDTPGMREIQLWADQSSLESSFEDIASISARCRFADCSHATEPGCAVREALDNGTISSDRWESYLKLQRELRHLETKQNVKAALDEKAKWKKIHKLAKEISRRKYGHGRHTS